MSNAMNLDDIAFMNQHAEDCVANIEANQDMDEDEAFTLPTYGGITLRPGAACAAYNINTATALHTDPVTFWRSQIAQKRTEIKQYEALLETVRTSGPTLGHLMRYVAWQTGVWDLEFCQEDDDYFPADYTLTFTYALGRYNDREEDMALMDERDEWDSMDLVEFTQRIAGDPLAVMILAFAHKLDPAQQIKLTSEQCSKLYGFLCKRNDLKAELADLLDTLAATEETRVVACRYLDGSPG